MQALEEVRMLSNLQSDRPVAAADHAGGAARADRQAQQPSMRQFSQRIAARTTSPGAAGYSSENPSIQPQTHADTDESSACTGRSCSFCGYPV